MASITIRNIPDELLDKIKERAKRERRSLNNEIIKILEDSATDKESILKFIENWEVDEGFMKSLDDIKKTRTSGKNITLDDR